MKNQILMITSDSAAPWVQTLARLGNLIFVTEAGLVAEDGPERFLLCVIDAAAVKAPDKLISQLRVQDPAARIVVMTASPTWRRARASFEAGALDYLPKNLNTEDLFRTIQRLLEKTLPPGPPLGVNNAATHRSRR